MCFIAFFPILLSQKVGSSCISTALKKGPTNFDMFSKLSYWWDPKNSLWTGKRGLFSALRCYTTIKRFFYSSPLSGLTLYKWEFSESGTLIGIPLIRRHVLLLKWPPLKASFNLGGQLILEDFSQLMMLISFSKKGSKKKLLINCDWRLVCIFAVPTITSFYTSGTFSKF